MRTNIKTSLLALAMILPVSGAWTVANELLGHAPRQLGLEAA